MWDAENFDNTPKVKKINRLPVNPEVSDPEKAVKLGHFPSWLHRRLPRGANLYKTGQVIEGNRLHTVCEEARCPNQLECWSKKTATFLVMGKSCTRNCGFCSIDFTKSPAPLEADEPHRVAESAKQLGLKHVVVTMVARDDLSDGGAQHLAEVIKEVRCQIPEATLEVLTSDFSGNWTALDIILEAQPEIFNHNIETVRELTPRVRHKATYERTLAVLEYVKTHNSQSKMLIKSGLMLGLGESQDQVYATLRDLHAVKCDIVTIGQYLQPDPNKLRVKSFIPPEEFKNYETFGYELGFKHMYCGPFIRSSYNAGTIIQQVRTSSPHAHS